VKKGGTSVAAVTDPVPLGTLTPGIPELAASGIGNGADAIKVAFEETFQQALHPEDFSRDLSLRIDAGAERDARANDTLNADPSATPSHLSFA